MLRYQQKGGEDMDNNFGQRNFDLNTAGAGNPWESVGHERPDLDAPVSYKRPLLSIPIVRILVFILAIFFALYLLYAVFVHPVNKLNFRLLLQKNCTMTMRVSMRHGLGYASGQTTMYLDGNLFAVAEVNSKDPHTFVYIEMADDKITVHDFVLGDWYHMDYEEYLFINGGSADSVDDFQKLFDRRNYERVRGKLFAWEIKDDVDMGTIYDVQFRRKLGKFTITWKEFETEYTVIFESFGWADLQRVWEE